VRRALVREDRGDHQHRHRRNVRSSSAEFDSADEPGGGHLDSSGEAEAGLAVRSCSMGSPSLVERRVVATAQYRFTGWRLAVSGWRRRYPLGSKQVCGPLRGCGLNAGSHHELGGVLMTVVLLMTVDCFCGPWFLELLDVPLIGLNTEKRGHEPSVLMIFRTRCRAPKLGQGIAPASNLHYKTSEPIKQTNVYVCVPAFAIIGRSQNLLIVAWQTPGTLTPVALVPRFTGPPPIEHKHLNKGEGRGMITVIVTLSTHPQN
jgi:hypothetical protein